MSKIVIVIDDDNNFPYKSSPAYQAHVDPCENCPNNPKNNPFASGVCSCVLPYMNQVMY